MQVQWLGGLHVLCAKLQLPVAFSPEFMALLVVSLNKMEFGDKGMDFKSLEELLCAAEALPDRPVTERKKITVTSAPLYQPCGQPMQSL